MNDPERQNMAKSNMMTAYTKKVLEEALIQAHKELSQAQLSIGEAAGSESDWHDNAAFDYANMEYSLKSANLTRLTKKLRDVEIIPPRQQTDRVGIGNTVVIKFEVEPEDETFTILGPDDSGKKEGWVSYLSPLGKSLIGKVVGETAEYSLGKERVTRIRIVSILPGNFE